MLSCGLYQAVNQTFANVSDFMANYSSYIHGIILFDFSLHESANIATPLCGIYGDVMIEKNDYKNNVFSSLNSKPIDVNLTSAYAAAGLNTNSTKGQIYKWAFDTWGAQCNQTTMAMLDTGQNICLRSFLCGRSIFTTWQPNQGNPLDPAADLATFNYILNNMPSDMLVLGWMGNDEGATGHRLVQA